ncbi:MAG: hypothetical protein JOY98_03920 [Candidatus Eremiobacteraeota bacterium]|nr:hypothetical protein [Candidatus Eremiobacteraeota bacterium]MBV8284383.1 hypothetical protein [Candidatus Eremiobacteraeota bacterium]
MATTLAGLAFLIGAWTCTSGSGAQQFTYTAVYAYDMQNDWISQHDTWTGGGDVGYLTYDAKGAFWNWVVLEPQGSTTVFHGTGPATHISYRTVYPPQSDGTEVFDRASDTKYATHFTGTLEGKKYDASDTCTKH